MIDNISLEEKINLLSQEVKKVRKLTDLIEEIYFDCWEVPPFLLKEYPPFQKDSEKIETQFMD